MNIRFRISDGGGVPVPSAILSVSYPTARGSAFERTLPATDAGGVTVLSFDKGVPNGLRLQDGHYTVTYAGKPYQAVVRSQEAVRDAQVIRIDLAVSELVIEREPEPGGDAPAGKSVKLTIELTADKEPLAGAQGTLSLRRAKGAPAQEFPLKTDEFGLFSVVLGEELYTAVDWPASGVIVTWKDATYATAVGIRPDRTADGAFASWPVGAEQDGDTSPAPNAGRLVFGRVSDSDGDGITGALVDAYEIVVGKEQHLGGAKTGTGGTYEIGYRTDALTDRTKAAANLVVRVSDGEEVLAESPLIPNAALKQEVNFTIGEGAVRGPSLFQTIREKVTPYLDGADPGAMRPHDAELLTHKTGLSATALARYFRAWHLAGDIGLGRDDQVAALFFGWLQGGLPSDARALLSLSDTRLVRAGRTAVDANWIRKMDPASVLARIRAADSGPDEAQASDFYRLLELAGIARSKGPAILSILQADLDETAKWDRIAGVAGKTKSTKLRDLVLGWGLLDRQIVLVDHLIAAKQMISAVDLAAVTEADLTAAIVATDAKPHASGGKGDPGTPASYAARIAEAIERRFPYDTFVAQLLASDKKPAAEAGTLLQKNPKVRFDELPEGAEPDEIAALRSLYLVGPKFRRAGTVAVLLDIGYGSAGQIVATGRPAFFAATEKPLGRPSAAAVFNRAVALVAAGEAAQARTLSVTPLDPAQDIADPSTLTGQIFQGALAGQCAHCESVLSPGAYLVDLYSFAALAQNGSGTRNGQQVLDERRPDLAGTNVSCANAETVMPYIDLVLEVLEDAVAPRPEGAEVRQTKLESPQLLAEPDPDHVNHDAYAVLAGASFPWHLPFDRAFARSRAYLDKAGAPMAALRAARETGASATGAAAARIGLAAPQGLVTTGSEGSVLRGYGKTSRAQLEKIVRFQDLAAHLQIAGEDLLELIETGFVSPASGSVVDGDGLLLWDELATDRLERLLLIGRLWRQTSMAIGVLDAILQVTGLPRDTSLASWLADVAAALDLMDDLRLDAEGFTRLMELPDADRRAELAGDWRIETDELDWAAVDLGRGTAKPADIAALGADLQVLADAKIEIVDAQALLQAPATPEAEFGESAAADVLAELTAALAATPPGEAPADESVEVDPMAALAEVAAETLAQAFGCSADSTGVVLRAEGDAVLRQALAAAGVAAPDGNEAQQPLDPAQTARLWKLCRAMDLIGLSADEAAATAAIAGRSGTADLTALPIVIGAAAVPLDRLVRLLRIQAVGARMFPDAPGVFRRLADIRAGAPIAETLEAAGGWLLADLDFIAGPDGLDFGTAQTFLSRQGILQIDGLLSPAAQLSVPAQTVWELADGIDGDLARDTLLGLYATEQEGWDVLAELNGPIREASRDALLTYVIHDSRKGGAAGFGSAFDVYEHYLIDVEMSACYETARVKQAAASVQQFVQRVLLGLEGDLALAEDHANEWDWRRNYRVWEANRKVFLFPENWIEPELRDNKTTLFKELEDALHKTDLNDETAEAALIAYARGLHRISNLELVGLLDDQEDDTVHVFGRTRDLPHEYFWCRREPNRMWTGWEPLGLEIEGDHLLPVVYNGRLFLFWCSIAETLDRDNADYLNQLAAFQTEEDKLRNDLNTLRRQIDDALANQTEFEEQADSNSAPFDEMYEILADAMAAIAEAAQDAYDAALADLTAVKAEIASLERDFTYNEVHLNWSQFNRLTGWIAPRRSSGSVMSILNADPYDKTHYRVRSRLFLRRLVDGEDLTILVSTDEGASLQPFDRTVLDFGSFRLDIVNEILEAVDATTYAPYTIPQVVESASRHYQMHSTGWWVHFAMVDNGADSATKLFERFDGSVGVSVVPATRALDDLGNAPALVMSQNHGYYIEPVGPALLPLLSAEKTKDFLPPPATVQAADVYQFRSVETPSVAQRSFAAAPVASYSATAGGGAPSKLSLQRRRGQVTQRATTAVAIDVASGAVANSGRVDVGPSATGSMTATGDLVVAGSSEVRAILEPETVVPLQAVAPLQDDRAWKFWEFYHPFTDDAVTALYRDGLKGLYQPDIASGSAIAQDLYRQQGERTYFAGQFQPTGAVALPLPVESFSFDRTRPYAVYNWELFFHAPFAVADELTRNRKFEDAQRWLHFIFNPVARDGTDTASVWRFGPFHEEHQAILQGESADVVDMAEEDRAAFDAQVAEWLREPFNPHAIARLRSVAYMRATVMAYLDNLIAWADDLFRRDTMESINDATQLYVFAAQLLGPKPVAVPEGAIERVGRSVSEVIAGVPPMAYVPVEGPSDQSPPTAPVTGFFKVFSSMCLPSNDRLIGYWDTIGDRLFKIRHCMNIEGTVRRLPLYQPPIDPALLVRAAAAGVSVADAVADLNAPLPHYRFTYVLGRAVGFASDVRALGASILAALEKRDAEELAQIRAGHEVTMAKRILDIRKERVAEAQAALDSIGRMIQAAMDRQAHLQGLIDENLLPQEEKELQKLKEAHGASQTAGALKAVASVLQVIPNVGADGPFPTVNIGGINFGPAMGAISEVSNFLAGQLTFDAQMQGREAGNIRRRQDWVYQKNQAEREIARLEKDQIAAEIRLAMTENELADQEQQIIHAEEAEAFLEGKFSNAALYGWMSDSLSELYYQAYKMAYDLAKQAEACFRFELDQPTAAFIGFGHWDSLRKGLLAGERLTLDLRRMEAAYLSGNGRLQELVKNVSLARLDPAALLALRSTGTCEFEIPEFLFDLDHPGHYRRRIKSVSLTIPALAGPQTTIGCSLTLTGSKVRVDAGPSADLEDRLIVQTISTSGAQNDAGLFQLDFQDPRYLPFEGAGAISQWTLRLPRPSLAQFDYRSIADVIVHVRYTAKRDAAFLDAVEDGLSGAMDAIASSFGAAAIPLAQLFSLRYDFPQSWTQICNTAGPSTIQIDLGSDRFPYLFAARDIHLVTAHFTVGEVEETLEIDASAGAIDLILSQTLSDAIRQRADGVDFIVEYEVGGQ